jgi:cell division protein FtsW
MVLTVALILMALGLVILYSASAITAAKRYNDEAFFLRKQALWACLAIVVMLAAARIDYHVWEKWSPWMFGIGLALLALVLIPGIGVVVNGARRWLRFSEISFQPSEFARLATLFFIARLLSRTKELSFTRGFLPFFLLGSTAVGLIAIEPDIGNAMLLAVLMLTLFVAGGAKMGHLLPMCGAGALGLALIALVKFDHVARRLKAFLEPEADPLGISYQLNQSLIAIGSGGLLGTGLGQGVQKLLYLPEPHSDFILAILGEELGFVGCLAVLGLFGTLAVVGAKIARRAPDRFGALLAMVLTWMVVLQACINIGVVTGCLPTKGMPLPFMSAGGTSLVFTCLAMGILINIGSGLTEGGTNGKQSGGETPVSRTPMESKSSATAR